MTLQTLIFFGLVLACPIGMMLMMRGGGKMNSGPTDASAGAQEKRIVDLEQEIARLKETAQVGAPSR